MQSFIIVAIMSALSVFMLSELGRNDSAGRIPVFKAENVAANILQYQNVINSYILVNYDALHIPIAKAPGNVEGVKQIGIIEDKNDQKVIKFNKKDLPAFLNYQSIVFNYSRVLVGESQPMPLLYTATTWSGYSSANIESSYAAINMIEVLGKLGENVSKHVYQGNATYWAVPWIFSQNNCQITELFVQLPDSSSGNSKLNELKTAFNRFCNQIQANSSYRFLTYVYLTPILNSDI